jgi:hypothetical protein
VATFQRLYTVEITEFNLSTPPFLKAFTVVKTRAFDAAAYLDSQEAIAVYLREACETRDPAFVTEALGTVARARHSSAHCGQSDDDISGER